MKYAILAAGEGSRLASEGVALPKPLVPLLGEAMIDRLARLMGGRVIVVTNGHTSYYIRAREGVTVVEAVTPSSMHSMHAIAPLLRGGKFVLTTVDTVFREAEFAALVEAFEASQDDGIMAVTDYVDDEKPLYISVDEDMMITGFHDAPCGCRYISGGIYCLMDRALDVLDRCIAQGQSRMRNFQRQLVAEGLRLRAFPFSKILDVDHAEDIVKAEEFLKGV